MKRLIKQLLSLPRFLFYKMRNNSIDLSSEIGSNTHLRDSRIGKWCHIGPRGNVNSAVIGNYTCVAPSCQIGGMEHPYWDLSISPLLSDECKFGKTTYIGHDVWIAANCIIRQGVTVGDGAVIGANSFVNKDIPPYAIAYGTPVKVVKYRFDDRTIQDLNESHYWEYQPREARRILDNIKQNKTESI